MYGFPHYERDFRHRVAEEVKVAGESNTLTAVRQHAVAQGRPGGG
jgi:hypothetical protein